MYLPSGTSRSKPFRLFCRTPRRRMHSSWDETATVSEEITRPRSEPRTETQTRRKVAREVHGGKIVRAMDWLGSYLAASVSLAPASAIAFSTSGDGRVSVTTVMAAPNG